MPILVIDESGGLTQAAEINADIISAIDTGIMDAVRFHEGNFQQHDGTGWVTVAELPGSGEFGDAP